MPPAHGFLLHPLLLVDSLLLTLDLLQGTLPGWDVLRATLGQDGEDRGRGRGGDPDGEYVQACRGGGGLYLPAVAKVDAGGAVLHHHPAEEAGLYLAVHPEHRVSKARAKVSLPDSPSPPNPALTSSSPPQ